MSEIVIDASIAAAWVFDDESDPRADALISRAVNGDGIVPQHWHLEVRNAVIMGERRGRLTYEQAQGCLFDLSQLRLRTDSEPDIDAALSLTRAHGLTIYDAVYLELALRRRAALATLDSRLGRAARAERVQTLP